MAANPLAGDPEKRGRAESPDDRALREPRDGGGEEADVEGAVAGEGERRTKRERPGDRAVGVEGVVEPPEEHQIEHGPEDPPPREGHADGLAQRLADQPREAPTHP